MHAGDARSGRLPVDTTMSATEDTVAPFAVGPVGSADDWEALLMFPWASSTLLL